MEKDIDSFSKEDILSKEDNCKSDITYGYESNSIGCRPIPETPDALPVQHPQSEYERPATTASNEVPADAPVRVNVAEPPKSNKLPGFIVFAVFSIILIGGAIAIFLLFRPLAEKADNISEPMTDVVTGHRPQTFAGNYSVKLETTDAVSRYTAVITEYASDNYRIDVITEYGKSMYTFTPQPDGSVISPEIGTGIVTYKEKINKLTIRFEKGGTTCEFSRIQ